jgi:enoyl-CoA hydratase/carnithine racemase
MDTSRSSSQPAGHISVEGHAGVLVARIDGGPHALFDPEIAKQLKELVDRADRDPDIRAVVFTGTHPDRFLSHSDVRWLQEGGTGFPPINTRIARLVARTARLINRVPVVRTLAGMTRLKTLLQLDTFHATFLKMNASGTIFVAALNGSALAVGAELAFACDLRIMADGDHVIGLLPHPGRIGIELAVNLPRPRDQLSTREQPEFLRLRRQLFDFIKATEQ